ncbi:MAG: crosslink repair DNA glycosylase YcaQ family protein [Dehalococcoidia bacterium]
MADLSNDEARRIALGAQGFAEARPSGRVDIRHLRRVMAKIELLQIDTVNVLVRAHYMPLFARLGPYPMSLLDEAVYQRRELFETWAHVASIAPVERYPLLRHRMDGGLHHNWERWAQANSAYVDAVLDEVRRRGPITAGELEDPGPRGGVFWVRTAGRTALDYLFRKGAVMIAGRSNFTRAYDLTERVLPRELLEREPPAEEAAQREMLLHSARAYGIGTAAELADYYRLRVPAAKALLRDLVREDALREVSVEGWKEPAYLHPDARTPRAINARALLAPFDSLIWDQNRKRTERLFGFRYVLEIYLPEKQREYGYYVYPFLLGDRLVARVDLKADRKRGRLQVKAAYVEDGEDERAVAGELAKELALMAEWLGLERVEVGRRGNLARELGRTVNG